MRPEVQELLVMRQALLLLDTLSSTGPAAPVAEQLRDVMEPLWYRLTQGERDAINGMPVMLSEHRGST